MAKPGTSLERIEAEDAASHRLSWPIAGLLAAIPITVLFVALAGAETQANGAMEQLRKSSQAEVQAELTAKRAELARTQDNLIRERVRLAVLRRRLAHSKRLLARRLVEIYEAGKPDAHPNSESLCGRLRPLGL